MKFKDIAAMCRRRKYAELFTDEESEIQFVSDGTAAFKLEGIPKVSAKMLLRMFSVDEKEKEKWFFTDSELSKDSCLAESVANERILENFTDALCFDFLGNELVPVKVSNGILLINRQYLKPFEKGEYIKFYERAHGDKKYIAVKDGFELKAVIAPFCVRKDFVERLENVYSGLLESGVNWDA